MTIGTGPTSREQATLAKIHETLSRLGVSVEPEVDDVSTLAAAIYERGGRYEIDAVRGSFRAEVRFHEGQAQGSGTGFGWTPSVALAFALVDALADDGDGTFGG